MSTYLSFSFTKAGIPVTGLTPTLTVHNRTLGTTPVNAEAVSEFQDGFYEFNMSDELYFDTNEYLWRCDGGADLSPGERYLSGEILSVPTPSEIKEELSKYLVMIEHINSRINSVGGGSKIGGWEDVVKSVNEIKQMTPEKFWEFQGAMNKLDETSKKKDIKTVDLSNLNNKVDSIYLRDTKVDLTTTEAQLKTLGQKVENLTQDVATNNKKDLESLRGLFDSYGKFQFDTTLKMLNRQLDRFGKFMIKNQ